MKNIYLLFLAFVVSFSANCQTLLAQWTFPTGTAADSLADGGLAAHHDAIRAIGTSAIDFSKNGLTTKSAQTTGWDNGDQTKYWQVSFTTTGYFAVKLSSRQQSGGNNPGPKDFKIQYRVGEAGTWTDVPGGTITTANDWTTGYVNNITLPADCDNQGIVYVRWLMNSNLPSAGSGNVLSSGISKIDDITINAFGTVGIDEPAAENRISVYPNPVMQGMFTLQTETPANRLQVISSDGKVVKEINSRFTRIQIETGNWQKGNYFLRLYSNQGVSERRIIVN